MKKLQNEKLDLDPRDLAILKCLQNDPRLGIADLARHVELSAPTVRERLQRLVETGVIRRWWIEIDTRALGFPICVYIRVRPMPGQLNKIAALANDLPQVVEAHRVTGEDCFIIKAYIKALENLDQLLDRFLAFGQTTTSIVQSSPVPQRGLPVPVSRAARKISRKDPPASLREALRAWRKDAKVRPEKTDNSQKITKKPFAASPFRRFAVS